jgi:hypothetical protein
MRWGVRDEMTNEHMTTALCMNELRQDSMDGGRLLYIIKGIYHKEFQSFCFCF